MLHEMQIRIETNLITMMPPRAGRPTSTILILDREGNLEYFENGYKKSPINFKTDEEEVIRKVEKQLNQETYKKVLDVVNQLMEQDDDDCFFTDVGDYTVEITYSSNAILSKSGTLNEPVKVKRRKLSDILEELVDIDELCVGKFPHDEKEEEEC